MKRLLVVFGGVVVLFLGVAGVRTARFRASDDSAPTGTAVTLPVGAAERLAGALRFPTISHEDPGGFDGAAFAGLHAYLAGAFPRVHESLERELVGEHSLLFTWRGTDPGLEPILLMGHLDVVPVEPGTDTRWQEDPFGGRVTGGFIWGRGAIDNKSAVVGTLEAVEMLLMEGFRPARTVLLAYGHDEEVGGTRGAREVAQLLRSRGVRLAFVVDEGGVIGDGILAGVTPPTALVGIAEKGFITVELTTQTSGGHSSMPPRQSAVGILGAAIARLEANPMAPRFEGATARMFDGIGPHLPLPQRAVFANLWATRPLVVRTLEGDPTTNAMVRTTTAVTIFQAGTKDNVLPSRARAVVNFRILPGDSIAGVLEHVRRVVDDPRVAVSQGGAFSAEPSGISRTTSAGYRAIEEAIRAYVPGAIVAPYQVVVVSDSRYFVDLAGDVYRFLPLRLTAVDLERIHGTDERIAIRDYENAVRVYRQIIVGAAG